MSAISWAVCLLGIETVVENKGTTFPKNTSLLFSQYEYSQSMLLAGCAFVVSAILYLGVAEGLNRAKAVLFGHSGSPLVYDIAVGRLGALQFKPFLNGAKGSCREERSTGIRRLYLVGYTSQI